MGMRFKERLAVLEEAIKRMGKDAVSTEEVAAMLDISVNYARDLLKVYAAKKGLSYRRGILYAVSYTHLTLPTN